MVVTLCKLTESIRAGRQHLHFLHRGSPALALLSGTSLLTDFHTYSFRQESKSISLGFILHEKSLFYLSFINFGRHRTLTIFISCLGKCRSVPPDATASDYKWLLSHVVSPHWMNCVSIHVFKTVFFVFLLYSG